MIEVKNPFKLGFAAQGEDTDMWKNLDGCEEARFFFRKLKMLKSDDLNFASNVYLPLFQICFHVDHRFQNLFQSRLCSSCQEC